jgi:hypothetical protein
MTKSEATKCKRNRHCFVNAISVVFLSRRYPRISHRAIRYVAKMYLKVKDRTSVVLYENVRVWSFIVQDFGLSLYLRYFWHFLLDPVVS